jgi:hypothetical protein
VTVRAILQATFPSPENGLLRYLKNGLFLLTPQTSLQAAPHKTQKTESILAKLRHKNSNKGFNIKFEMTLSPQEKR